MSIYYVYLLIDPRNNLPFYIGNGKCARMYDHENTVKNKRIPHGNTFLFNKISKILSEGYSIIYRKIHENLDEKTALEYERNEELRIRSDNVELCNLVPCGSGGNVYQYMTEEKFAEIRQKISNSSKGRTHSKETRLKLRNLQLGRIRSEETKKKISIAKTGIKMTDVARKRMSESHIGLVKSESTRKKLSKSLKGRKFSSEHCSKLSEISKKRVGSKNSNFRPLSLESENFILSNIDKPVYWIFRHLSESVSYGKIKRRIMDLKRGLLWQVLKK